MTTDIQNAIVVFQDDIHDNSAKNSKDFEAGLPNFLDSFVKNTALKISVSLGPKKFLSTKRYAY